jgi:transcriptional regulator with XRE-family HTH domain
MKFDDWLKAQKMTSAEFARLSGIGDRQAVHKYRHGERFPTPENLQRIRRATGGAVTANDFVDQHAPDAVPPPPANDAPKPKSKRPVRRTAETSAAPQSSAKAA